MLTFKLLITHDCLQVGVDFCKSSNFDKAFKKIVWDMTIEPNVFENTWNNLMEEYAFKGKTKDWFTEILKSVIHGFRHTSIMSLGVVS